MHKFKIGETLVLKRPNIMSAKIGAKVLVLGYETIVRGEDLVDLVNVKWLDKLSNGQYPGGYYEHLFDSISKEWDE